MTDRAAIHDGECQLCGHVQKLPGERLAKHGYTKRWGFFSGQCPGSHREPYEISCALIEARIPEIERQLAQTIEASREVRADREIVRFEQRVRNHNRGTFSYVERSASVAHCSFASGEFLAPVGEETVRIDSYQLGYARDVEAAVAYLNGRAADRLDRTVAQLAQYLAWCRERVGSWKLKPLRPAVRRDPAQSKVCSYHGCRRHKAEGDTLCYIHRRREAARAAH